MCSSYTTWTTGMWIGPAGHCGTPYGGTTVTYGGRLYTHKGYCSNTGPGTWDYNDIGTCTVCTDRTVGAASGSPSVCVNTAITNITHTTTEVTGVGSSSGLPAGVSASYSSNTITISGTPTAVGTFNYTITPTSSCGSATATGTITVTAVPTISGSVSGSRCNSGTVSIQATASAGSIEWFTTASGGASIGSSSSGANWTTPSISTTTIYYAEALNDCESSSRTAVTATVNTASIGPGGITDELFLWLKSDAGTGSIGTSWEDQSCNGFDYTTVTGPTLESTDWNFNAAIEILSGGFNAPSGAEIGSDWTIFFVSKLMESDKDGRLFEAHSGNYLLGYHGGYRNGLYMNGSPSSHNSGIASTSGVTDPHVFTYVRESSGSTIDARVDGDALATYESTNSGSGIRLDINQGLYSSSQSSDSRVGEFIIYNKELTDAQIMKVEAYLAAKYGLALSDDDGSTGGDYISTSGTTYWDASVSTEYNNDIVVLGRDDNTALTQKQAKTQDDSLKVFISVLAASNSINFGSISNDESFLTMGHNGGRLRSNLAAMGEIPDGINSRLEREWKITNTNFDDDFTLEVEWDSIGDVSLSDLRLLVDDDGDFSNATVYGSDDGLTFSFGSIIVGGIGTSIIPSGSTKYFTLASASPSTPLPVELTYFNAFELGAKVLLKWQTTAEINNDYFMLQKSSDGTHWNQIGLIMGAGNSSDQIDYSYVDEEGCEEMCYYRLVQVDYDGTSKYYDAIVLRKGEDFTGCKFCLEIFPNPVQDIAQIKYQIDEEEIYNLVLYNAEGQKVKSKTLKGKEGINYAAINLLGLTEGVYVFSISNSNNEHEQQLIIKK